MPSSAISARPVARSEVRHSTPMITAPITDSASGDRCGAAGKRANMFEPNNPNPATESMTNDR